MIGDLESPRIFLGMSRAVLVAKTVPARASVTWLDPTVVNRLRAMRGAGRELTSAA